MNSVTEMPGRTISLAFQIFKTGTELLYNGRRRVISNVVLKGCDLFVHLEGDAAPVDSRLLQVVHTEFRLTLFGDRATL